MYQQHKNLKIKHNVEKVMFLGSTWNVYKYSLRCNKTLLVTTPQNDTCTVYFLQTVGQEFGIEQGLKHLFNSLLDFGNRHVF
jgi:hypothetical protein